VARLAYISDDQVVVALGHLACQVRPDIQLGIGDDGGALAGLRVGPRDVGIRCFRLCRCCIYTEAGSGNACRSKRPSLKQITAIDAFRILFFRV
jgi:hypothetical protein